MQAKRAEGGRKRPFSWRLGLLVAALAATVAWGWRQGSLAQGPTSDPVEGLRLILRTPAPVPAERDRRLQSAVPTLHTIADLRRALLLQEWRDQDVDDKVAAVDKVHRATVARRFAAAVRGVLQSGETAGRLGVVDLLGQLGTEVRATDGPGGLTREFGPDLAALVAQQPSPVREAAARALGRTNPDPRVAVPALARLLGDGDAAGRVAAAEALLGLLHTSAHLAVEGTSANGVQTSRAEVLAVAAAVVSAVGPGLTDPEAKVCCLCLEAVRQATAVLGDGRREDDEVGPGKQLDQERAELRPLLLALTAQAPALARALADPDAEVRRQARRTLEELALARQGLVRRGTCATVPASATGPVRQAVHLVPAADDPLGDGLRVALAPLVADMADPDVGVRRTAVDFLETLAPAEPAACRALVKALGDRDRSVRRAAARTLGKVAPYEAVTVVPALATLLADADLDLRLAAVGALKCYGPAAKAAVPDLLGTAAARDAELRLASLRALEEVAPKSGPVVAALRTALADDDARVRQLAAEVLGRFGPAARDAAEALRQLLADTSPDVRQAASEALANIAQP